MLRKLGMTGVLGLVAMLLGVGLVASESLVVAAGLALVLAGLGILVYGMVSNLLVALGMGELL